MTTATPPPTIKIVRFGRGYGGNAPGGPWGVLFRVWQRDALSPQKPATPDAAPTVA